LPHHLQMLNSTYHASQETRSTPPKDWISEGKATLPKEAHLVITPAPSDHDSSASVDEGALPGRKRSFAEAMGGDESSQARRPAPVPQDIPHGSRGQDYQYGVCSPYLPPTYTSLLAQTFATNPLRNVLPAMSQHPKPRQVHADPVTGSQDTLDILTMAATRPPLGMNHFYPLEVRTLNQPPGSAHHIYPGTRQPIPTGLTGDGTTSIGPAHQASTQGVYDGSQILQGVVSQSMPPYSLTQWTHEQPVRGYGSEYIAGTTFQESPALARNNVGGSSVWPPTSGAPSWQGM
jgi:hypothetical protein